MTNTTRRRFLRSTMYTFAGLAASPVLAAVREPTPAAPCGPFLRNNKLARKAIVLGMDGLDPVLVRRFVDEGKMPTFKRLMGRGHFGTLRTTMPPQSPVCWASFISGTNPGGHGIFDFVHRDPATFTPYLSTSRSFGSDSQISLGSWSIPLSSGRVDLLRKGPALWEPFEANDVPATIFQVPANFPVIGKGKTRAISGMGTPDLCGTYGMSSYFSDTPVPDSDEFTSVRVARVRLQGHKARAKLVGPPNAFKSTNEPVEIDFTVTRDPTERVLRIDIQDRKFILKQGEWSDWIPLRFEFIPYFASVSGNVRFLAKEVHPGFKLYVSPIQIDPLHPSMPISNPAGYSAEVAEAIGLFHTQGLPADIKALSYGVLSDEQYWEQAKTVLAESERALDFELGRLDEGLLFFYFSSPDQNEHMMWRNMDPTHPLFDPGAKPEVQDAVSFVYRRMDDALNRALARVDGTTLLMVMSDHGFAPFTREFHLSTWLVEQGYTAVQDKQTYHDARFFECVDWGRTQAYALGINGLYLNLKGREKQGSLRPEDGDRVKREIIRKLERVTDPSTGRPVVMKAYDAAEIYSGPFTALAPDILVGYHPGYRSSDEAVLGKFPEGVLRDRNDKWAADHCMDPRAVPGTLLTNWRCTGADPALWDLAPSIIRAFGLPVPEGMTGRPLLEAT